MKGHPHHKKAAMQQFNEGHWQKTQNELSCGGSRYVAELGEVADLDKNQKALAEYAKKNKMHY